MEICRLADLTGFFCLFSLFRTLYFIILQFSLFLSFSGRRCDYLAHANIIYFSPPNYNTEPFFTLSYLNTPLFLTGFLDQQVPSKFGASHERSHQLYRVIPSGIHERRDTTRNNHPYAFVYLFAAVIFLERQNAWVPVQP